MQIEVTRWPNTKRKTRALIRVRYGEIIEKSGGKGMLHGEEQIKFERRQTDDMMIG